MSWTGSAWWITAVIVGAIVGGVAANLFPR